jgi:ABC-type bacteriocin/lantibiotic exporter with double-glycine peptidase domain/CRP-like cAMP-binding protein
VTHHLQDKQVPFFKFFPEEQRAALQALFVCEHYAFGDVIVEQGAPADALYIIVDGRARVYRTAEDGHEVPLNTLHEGDEFGEMALVEGGYRTATVRCSSAAEVWRLDRESFDHYLAEHPDARDYVALRIRQRRLHNFLKEGSALGALPLPVLRQFLSELEEQHVEPGKDLVEEGDTDAGFYVLVTGQVKVFQGGGEDQRLLGYLRAGDYFGELSVLRETGCAATVQAVTPCTVLMLPADRLRSLLADHPPLRDLMEQRAGNYAIAHPNRLPLDIAHAQGNGKDHPHTSDARAQTSDPREHASPWWQKLRAPHVPQLDEMDCGAAALATACLALGRPVQDMPALRDHVYSGPQGSSLTALQEAAADWLGLEAHARKLETSALDRLEAPAILHLRNGHWVVLLQFSGHRLKISDPAAGVGWLRSEELRDQWSGHALLLAPGRGAPQDAPPPAQRWLAECFHEAGMRFIPAAILALPQAAIILTVPALARNLMGTGIFGPVSLPLAFAVAILILLLAGAISLYRRRLITNTERAMADVLVRRLSEQLLEQPLSRVLQRRAGEWAARFDDALRLVRMMGQVTGEGAFAGSMFVIAVTAAFATSSIFGSLTAGWGCIALLVGFSVSLRKRRTLGDQDQVHSPLWERAVPVLGNIDVIKMCNGQGHFTRYLTRRARGALEFGGLSPAHVRGDDFLGMLLTGLAVSTMLAVALGLSPQTPTVDRAVGGIFVTAMSVYGSLRVGSLLAQEQTLQTARMRLDDLFASQPEDASGHRMPVPTIAGKITMRRVSAAYTSRGKPALQNVDLEIPAGACVAVVGAGNAGKSTLLLTLGTLIDPTEGTLLFDGVSAADLSRSELRKHLGMLPHRPAALPGSITENICGAEIPDTARLETALRVSGLHDVLPELPNGADTVVGPNAWRLTEEQQQRLALARVLYQRPAVALLDDGLRDLDDVSCREVMREALELLADGTRVYVPRRMTHCRFADAIAVLENGELVEFGAHDELMARGGLYAHRCMREQDNA